MGLVGSVAGIFLCVLVLRRFVQGFDMAVDGKVTMQAQGYRKFFYVQRRQML